LSNEVCSVSAKLSTLLRVLPILNVPKIATEGRTDLSNAIEHKTTKSGRARFFVILKPVKSSKKRKQKLYRRLNKLEEVLDFYITNN
jgi:hypothetical protein